MNVNVVWEAMPAITEHVIGTDKMKIRVLVHVIQAIADVIQEAHVTTAEKTIPKLNVNVVTEAMPAIAVLIKNVITAG